MERVIERCAGLDVHKKTVAACVRVRGTQHVRTFGTTAPELLVLRDWLFAHEVTHVAMESTGVYWKPIFYVLEDAFTCVLSNAAQIAQVPGRKTDVKDCMWIELIATVSGQVEVRRERPRRDSQAHHQERLRHRSAIGSLPRVPGPPANAPTRRRRSRPVGQPAPD